jgi:hypothetical protein
MAARGFSYEVSLRLLRNRDGQLSSEPRELRFEHRNHDDLFAIVERVRASAGLAPDDAAATAVGLKLLAEVMLREKRNPLFDPLREGMGKFIAALKSQSPAGEV